MMDPNNNPLRDLAKAIEAKADALDRNTAALDRLADAIRSSAKPQRREDDL
jgi:hypothetical protein